MKLNQNRSKKFDEEIDAALKLLREVQPPMGMMSRIHRRLETATLRRASSIWLFWVPAAGAAMATIVLVIFSQTHSTWGKQTSTAETAKVVAAPTALPDRATTQSTMVAAENFHGRKLSAVRVHPISHRQRGEYRHANNLLSYPLTRQERLLVKFLQTAKPADLRDLNLEGQVKMKVVQDAEFVAYLKLGSSPSYNETIENTQE